MPLRALEPKSRASANSATFAQGQSPMVAKPGLVPPPYIHNNRAAKTLQLNWQIMVRILGPKMGQPNSY